MLLWTSGVALGYMLYALLVNVRLLDVLKSGIGFEAFFVSLIFFPILLRVVTVNSRLHFWLPQTIIIGFFILEYLQLVSLKEMGLVSWRLSAEQLISTKEFIDDRPSGIFGEPSWFGLSLAVFLRLTIVQKRHVGAWALIAGCVIALSGSSLGIVAWALVVLPLIISKFAIDGRVTRTEAERRRALFAVALLIFAMAAAVLIGLIYYSSKDVDLLILQKIGDPFAYASGVNRYVAPIYFVGEALASNPIVGLGMHYIPDYLTGRTGAAVLPFNVLIELGISGLIFYAAVLFAQIRYYKTPVYDLFLCALLLGGLGLQYTAFQGALLATVIVARALESVPAARDS